MTLNISQFDAVIFDLDGTLVDSMWIWADIDAQYLIQHGFQLPPDLQKAIEGMSTTETAQYFKDRFSIEHSIEQIKSEWVAMAHQYYAQRIPLKQGAHNFLQMLLQRGIKIGIGTSNFRDLAELVLERYGLLSQFHSLRTSCEVEKGKPAPDVFLKVAQDLGVEPSKCLVFEDTHAGVLAAKAAGMSVIAVFDPLSEPYHSEMLLDAHCLIYTYDELDYMFT